MILEKESPESNFKLLEQNCGRALEKTTFPMDLYGENADIEKNMDMEHALRNIWSL